MGVTILYSSGDDGVAGNNGDCLEPNGRQTPNGKIFNPSFPGTWICKNSIAVRFLIYLSGGCPFVTSVGATQVNPGAKVRLRLVIYVYQIFNLFG